MKILSGLESGELEKQRFGAIFLDAAWRRMTDQIFTSPG